MPFTPESAINAEKLDRPHVIIDAADPLKFSVEWKHHSQDITDIDPIIEIFRPIRDRVRKDHDVHIVATSSTWTDKKVDKDKIRRTYILSYCPGERSHVDRRLLAAEFKEIQPRLLGTLQEILDAWIEAENGLALFLREGNKESIHNFLISIGLRQPETTKEERRDAYLKKHPEHKKTAKPKPRKKTSATAAIKTANELLEKM